MQQQERFYFLNFLEWEAFISLISGLSERSCYVGERGGSLQYDIMRTASEGVWPSAGVPLGARGNGFQVLLALAVTFLSLFLLLSFARCFSLLCFSLSYMSPLILCSITLLFFIWSFFLLCLSTCYPLFPLWLLSPPTFFFLLLKKQTAKTTYNAWNIPVK